MQLNSTNNADVMNMYNGVDPTLSNDQSHSEQAEFYSDNYKFKNDAHKEGEKNNTASVTPLIWHDDQE